MAKFSEVLDNPLLDREWLQGLFIKTCSTIYHAMEHGHILRILRDHGVSYAATTMHEDVRKAASILILDEVEQYCGALYWTIVRDVNVALEWLAKNTQPDMYTQWNLLT